MEHLHEEEAASKKTIHHVVEKFRKRGVKIATCKPRTMMSFTCLEEMDKTRG
ncbi:hypothetical protein [Geobacillus sp. C56-T2]|uniref:hypothetical protein n=1 Tax=Geobacillus sp. C56-T2 TaxID=600773 RepID=UPI0011ABB035|nr:hypothetical protein [Geobacillus sp. C56-T2]TWG30925.1 hypothetical protein GC56T2_2131 [Geobacillus sp. C56-T2]